MSQRGARRRSSGLGGSLGRSGLGVVTGFILVALVILAFGVARGIDHHGAPLTGSTTTRSGSSASASRSAGSPRTAVSPARSSSRRSPSSVAPAGLPHIAVPSVSAEQLAALPRATTYAVLDNARTDLRTPSSGNVVQIATDVPAFRTPGGRPIAVIPSEQIGMPTWLPVIGHRADWIRVRLPSRPNGATAWLPAAGLRQAQTTWSVRVRLDAGTLTIRHAGADLGSWPIGHGADATPTPTGQTFLMAAFSDPGETYSPVIYATGAHSDTLDSFGGGPGTVAVHGWPTRAGRIGKVSHGCVRVPADALEKFSLMPLGTPISITH